MSNEKKAIAIGCDHAGVQFKTEIIEWLKENNYEVCDCGCYNNDSVDYPDIAYEVCSKIKSGDVDKAILICGTGIGISISANKINGIRAALCHDYFSAKFTRVHNDANVICFGARVIGTGLAMELVDVFLKTEFEGGRHQRRVDKMMELQGK
ncbi:MAG: ribose 5-phosphate isomerase B [Oscillospiraceae bacterium]